MNNYKLGRLPVKNDARNLKLASYLPRTPLPRPNRRIWSSAVKEWLMLGNDKYGDCTCAGILHMLMLWKAQNSIQVCVNESDALSIYHEVTGFNPNDPSTDNGAHEIDVLNYCRQNIICGSKIVSAYVSIDVRTPKVTIEQICQAINLFGGIYIGADMYQSAMDEFAGGFAWKRTTCTGAFKGGHAFAIIDYDDNRQIFTCITWGVPHEITYAWALAFIKEGYAIYSPSWLNNNGVAPSGFNETQLIQDLNEVTKD